MDTNFLKILLFTAGIILCSRSMGQYATHVTVTDVSNATLSQTMQENTSQLLTELNHAFSDNTKPRLAKGILTQAACKSLLSLWETSSFRCYETSIIEKGLHRVDGAYEVRNIPLFFSAADTSSQYQEGVIIYRPDGTIDDFYIAIEANQYSRLIKEGISVTDFRRRQVILDFIENFRTAYNRKDLQLLNKIYSNDALIITGRVVKVKEKSSDMVQLLPADKIDYQIQTKGQYLKRLESTFRNNAYINIKFNDILITQHKKYPEVYGVNLKQNWDSPNYHDVGYLYILIDFMDEQNPLIRVRTWQPEKVNDKVIETKDIFSNGDFDLGDSILKQEK